MILFEIDYGELLRPPFQVLPSRGWGQCTNNTEEILVVYGPKQKSERSIFDTSPYILGSGSTTPDHWDCDGFFVPNDRSVLLSSSRRSGPMAIKFWNLRRFSVSNANPTTYKCSWPNGVFEPSQINWAIPNLSHEDIVKRADRGPAL